MKVAIIDLGTNTFNLLVVGWKKTEVQKLHSSKISVRLGDGGFADKKIQEAAFNRGLLAFSEHVQQAQLLGVEQVYAFATSAVRGASNGKDFVKAIYQQHKIKVDVITGDREADLIYKGVQASGVLTEKPVLIMDIGGGSTEFIIGTNDHIIWKQSFSLGAARILELFKPSDPITDVEIAVIENFLHTAVENVFSAIRSYPIDTLVGSSGTFDSLVDMIQVSYGKEPCSETNRFSEIPVRDYHRMHRQLLKSTLAERYNMPGLIPLRVDFIVIAIIFINLIVKEANVSKMWQSGYSLKEGVVAELKRTVLHG